MEADGRTMTKRRRVNKGKRLPWEDKEEDSESESEQDVIVTSALLTDRDFDRRRYLRQLATNTKDLETIEPRVFISSSLPTNNNKVNVIRELEKEMHMQKVPCSNSFKGCGAWLSVDFKSRHEASCLFRDVLCPVSSCSQRLPVVELSYHLSSLSPSPHSLVSHLYTNPGPITFTRIFQTYGATDPVWFSFKREQFYLQTITSQDGRFLYHFVQLEGDRDHCEDFWVTLTVSSPEGVKRGEVSQTMRPVPIDIHCSQLRVLNSLADILVMTKRNFMNISSLDTSSSKCVFQVSVTVREERKE